MNKENEGSNSNSAGSEDGLGLSSSEHVVLIGGHNIWEWAFLLTCIPNVAVLLVSSILTITMCDSDCTLHNPYFALEVVICILCGISITSALYGIFAEHQYDIYLHSAFLLVALVFSWISFGLHMNFFLIKVVCNGIATLLWIVSFVLNQHATHVPDWNEFRIIGASEALAALYKQLCYFLVILKFDSVLVVMFAIFSAQISMNFTDEKNLLFQGLVLAYALLSWICGKLAVCKEDKHLAFGFSVLNGVYPALIVFQLYIVLYDYVYEGKSSEVFRSITDKHLLYYSCTAFGLFAIMSKLYLLVHVWKTCKTFDYGLNTRSFQDLVSRDSTSLLAHSRSAVLF